MYKYKSNTQTQTFGLCLLIPAQGYNRTMITVPLQSLPFKYSSYQYSQYGQVRRNINQTIPRIGSEQMVPTIQCLLKSFLTQDVFLDKYIFKQSVKVKHDFQTFGIHINVRTFNFYAKNFINHRKATSLKPVLSTGCLTPTHWCGIKTNSNIWKNYQESTCKASFKI